MDTSRLTADAIADAVAARIAELLPSGVGVGPQFLSANQVAELTGISTKTLEFYRAKRIGPPWLVIGTRTIRYSRAAVLAWIAKSGPIK